uniref:Uncharacterized protein n=1 Tax=Avena sativa TaxID=4498 RepID=A0ACD5ZB93_AVESA
MYKFLRSLIRRRGKDDDNIKEQRYGPWCGVTSEEYEWRRARAETVDQLMPQMLEKLNVLLQRTRPHFLDDSHALEKWDNYEGDVLYGFENNLRGTLMAPVSIPNSVAYQLLMERTVSSRTLHGRVSGGLEKLKQAATKPPTRNKRSVRTGVILAGVAAAFALGIAVGRNQLHGSSKQQTNEIVERR